MFRDVHISAIGRAVLATFLLCTGCATWKDYFSQSMIIDASDHPASQSTPSAQNTPSRQTPAPQQNPQQVTEVSNPISNPVQNYNNPNSASYSALNQQGYYSPASPNTLSNMAENARPNSEMQQSSSHGTYIQPTYHPAAAPDRRLNPYYSQSETPNGPESGNQPTASIQNSTAYPPSNPAPPVTSQVSPAQQISPLHQQGPQIRNVLVTVAEIPGQTSSTQPKEAHSPIPAYPQPPTTQITSIEPVSSTVPPIDTKSQPPSVAPPLSAPPPQNTSSLSANTEIPPQAISSQLPSSDATVVSLAKEQVQIEDVIRQLEKYAASGPQDLNVQLALRCLYQAYGLEDKAAAPLGNTPQAENADSQALAKALLLAGQAIKQSNQNNPELANRTLQALESLRQEIANRADLQISTLKICQEAPKAFGQYQELPLADLQSGKTKTIWIYCELENFKTTANEEGKYFSRLNAEITLYDSDFRIVTQFPKSEVRDAPSIKPRRDFYLRGSLNLPDLKPGKYQLVMVVEDLIAGKTARPNRIDFEVKTESPAKK